MSTIVWDVWEATSKTTFCGPYETEDLALEEARRLQAEADENFHRHEGQPLKYVIVDRVADDDDDGTISEDRA